MKRLYFTLVMAMAIITLQAQRLIAVKGANTDAVVQTLDEAITVAEAGDVIYLPGGVAYTISDTIKKPIHIIGTGYNKEITRATLVSIIRDSIIIGAEAKGTIIEGVWINNTGNFHIYADETILRRCLIRKQLDFKSSKNCLIINCIAAHTIGSNVTAYNSVFSGYIYWVLDLYDIRNWGLDLDDSEINNCIVYFFKGANNSIVNNTIWNYSNNGHLDFQDCLNASIGATCKGVNTANFTTHYNQDFHLKDSIANLYPNLGIYKGAYPWKDGGQPITPHIEENNSYLDVQNQKFKLRVKVKAQSN